MTRRGFFSMVSSLALLIALSASAQRRHLDLHFVFSRCGLPTPQFL